MSSAAQDARERLAGVLTTWLPPEWTVYASPPDGVVAPAAVVAPGEPYRTATAFRSDELTLRVIVMLQAATLGALDALDEQLELVLAALLKDPAFGIRQAGSVGQVQDVGGVQLLTATIDLVVTIERSRR